MLSHQMQLLRKVSRGPVPLTRTVFYNEVGEFLNEGLLTPPTDPLLIWNYSSEQRDHYPRPEIFHPHSPQQEFGYYLNLQFFTTGSHLTAGEGPWKVGQNLRQVATGVQPGHMRLVVLNVGNVREFTMEIAVASAVLWDSTMTVNAALDAFCERYYGTASAKTIRDLYHSYYYAFWEQKKPDLKNFGRQYIFHDLRYARAAENLLARLETGHYSAAPLFQDPHMLKIDPADSHAQDETHAIFNGTTMSIERFQKVVTASQHLAPQIAEVNRSFFDESLQSDAGLMLAANYFLRDVANAYIEVNDTKSASQYLASAAMHLEEMRTLVVARQRPHLAGWYEHETKFDLDGMTRRLEHARLILSQNAKSHEPSTPCISSNTSLSAVAGTR